MKSVTLLWLVIGLIIGLVHPMNDGLTVMSKIAFAIPFAAVLGVIALVVDLVISRLKKKNRDNSS